MESTVAVAAQAERTGQVSCLCTLAQLRDELPTLAPDTVRLARVLDIDTKSTKKVKTQGCFRAHSIAPPPLRQASARRPLNEKSFYEKQK